MVVAVRAVALTYISTYLLDGKVASTPTIVVQALNPPVRFNEDDVTMVVLNCCPLIKFMLGKSQV